MAASKEEVDAAFAAWTREVRHLATTGDESRSLVGAMQGVAALTHLMAKTEDQEIIDDVLVALNFLCLDEESVEEFIINGGLQVLADALLHPKVTTKVQSHVMELLRRVLVTPQIIVTFVDLNVFPSMIQLLKLQNYTVIKRTLIILHIFATVPVVKEGMWALGVQLVEPVMLICRDNMMSDLCDRGAELLLVLLGTRDQWELYVEANVVGIVLQLLAHCPRQEAKEYAITIMAVMCEDLAVRRAVLERGNDPQTPMTDRFRILAVLLDLNQRFGSPAIIL